MASRARATRPEWEGSEWDWVVPAMAMTAALAVFVVVFSPPGASFTATFATLPLWLLAGAILYLCVLLGQTVRLMRGGEPSPFRALRFRIPPLMAVGYVLAGINMTLFMCVKPILNLLIPFRADPFLAKMDELLFLGAQPGQLLSFLNTDGMAVFYHRGWFVLLVAALAIVLLRPASSEKSALLNTYFALWTLAGPLVHALLPAGGPIFYERLTGDAFALSSAPITSALSDQLWAYYATATFGPGAGISAMPSLHIATMAWAWLVFRQTRFAVPVALCAVLIFLLSISLGWHYAWDGLVGAALCWAIFRILRVPLAKKSLSAA